jgi:hypothetical protein
MPLAERASGRTKWRLCASSRACRASRPTPRVRPRYRAPFLQPRSAARAAPVGEFGRRHVEPDAETPIECAGTFRRRRCSSRPATTSPAGGVPLRDAHLFFIRAAPAEQADRDDQHERGGNQGQQTCGVLREHEPPLVDEVQADVERQGHDRDRERVHSREQAGPEIRAGAAESNVSVHTQAEGLDHRPDGEAPLPSLSAVERPGASGACDFSRRNRGVALAVWE